jgi:hypothetical protein
MDFETRDDRPELSRSTRRRGQVGEPSTLGADRLPAERCRRERGKRDREDRKEAGEHDLPSLGCQLLHTLLLMS